MSVIVRRNNQIVLYCKGADNVIYDRLSSDQSELKTRTQEHLNVNLLSTHWKLERIVDIFNFFFESV